MLEALHVQREYHRAANFGLDHRRVEHGWRAFELGGEKTLLPPAAITDVLEQLPLPAVVKTDEQRDLQLLHQAAGAVHLGDLESIADEPLAEFTGLFAQDIDDEEQIDWASFGQPVSPLRNDLNDQPSLVRLGLNVKWGPVYNVAPAHTLSQEAQQYGR